MRKAYRVQIQLMVQGIAFYKSIFWALNRNKVPNTPPQKIHSPFLKVLFACKMLINS